MRSFCLVLELYLVEVVVHEKAIYNCIFDICSRFDIITKKAQLYYFLIDFASTL